MSTAKEKTSKIWSYYKITALDSSEAVCKVCKLAVKRGGQTSRTFSTSNLINHLKKRHPAEYLEFQSACKSKIKNISLPCPVLKTGNGESVACLQTNLEESFELQRNGNKWPTSHPKAKVITCNIAEMIAIDSESFSIVENMGFKRLLNHLAPNYDIPSRRVITDETCVHVYGKVEQTVRKLVSLAVENCRALSLTTDIWSATNTPVALMSLTLHFIDGFERKNVMLSATPLGEESHTGQFLAEKLKSMLGVWEIKASNIHLLIRDNAANIAKGCTDAKIDSHGCFIHSLQLVIKDGITCQRAVGDIISKCRSIVGHFKHSPTASSRLKSYQQQYGCLQHRLIQDEPTRWDSTFCMCERILEQKKALVAYQCDFNSITFLTAHQWQLLERVINLLSPFQQITKECSSEHSSVGDIIPFLMIITKALENITDDSGVQTMKDELIKSLRSRFSSVESSKKIVLATTLDPRYKLSCFRLKETIGNATAWILDEIQSNYSADGTNPETEKSEVTTVQKKRQNIFDFFTELGGSSDSPKPTQCASEVILQKYLEEPLLPRKIQDIKSCPLKYWQEHTAKFPQSPLAEIACKYLSAPATSVQSERLFSLASGIYTDKRNRLQPEKAEKLLFIKCNYKHLH